MSTTEKRSAGADRPGSATASGCDACQEAEAVVSNRPADLVPGGLLFGMLRAHFADKPIRCWMTRNVPRPTKAVRPIENKTLKRWTCLILRWTLRIFRLPDRLFLLLAAQCDIAVLEERRRPVRGFRYPALDFVQVWPARHSSKSGMM